MDDAWPARWPPPPPAQQQQPPAPVPPPLPSQIDSMNLRYHLSPFAAAAMPGQLVSNPWSSLFGGQPAKAGPTNSLLAHVPGNYPHVSHVTDLKALLEKPSASNAAAVADPPRAPPLGGASSLPKYPNPRHGPSAGGSVEQSSSGAPFLSRSSNAQGALPGEGSATNDGISHGAIQFQDSIARTMQKFPSKSIPGHNSPALPGPNNSLLPQVPGNYVYGSSIPDLRALLNKPNESNAAAVIDLTRASPLGGAVLLPKYRRDGFSASSNAVQSAPTLFPNKSSIARGALTVEGSANVGISDGTIQSYDSSAQTTQKLPSKSVARHHPALLWDRVRVSCLNVGGEFFMGEAGLFGVLCLCHQLRMSVAKFCEHAGGPAEKAGEIVRMENGMSIAQWFKYCVKVGASADTNWDWPEYASMDYTPGGHRLKSFLTRNSSMEQIGLFRGYGKITGPTNRTVYSDDLYNEARGCTSVEKLVNKREETYYRKSTDVHPAFTKNSALEQNTAINLGLARNHTANPVNLSAVTNPSGCPYFTTNMGGSYGGNHLAHSYENLLEKNYDTSFHNRAPSSMGVSSYDSKACRSYFPSRICQENLGSASNTELKLGQSPHHQSRTSLFPFVQSAAIDFQKPQSHQPLVTQNPCPRQTNEVNRSTEKQKHTEAPFGTSTRNKKQSLEVANASNRSEGGELTDDAAKNSFISLFLSHLERNSESINDILNSNEHYLPKALDGVYSSVHSKIASRQVEPRANNNLSRLPSNIVRTNGRSDGRSPSMASSEYVSQAIPVANSQEPLTRSDCLSHLLPSQLNAGISKTCARVPCPANCRSCNHVSDISHQVGHAEASCVLCDKMARRHSTFECLEDICTHQSSRVAKISCPCEKSCCPSSREFHPTFRQGDQSKLGQSIHRCCCELQEDVPKPAFRAGDLCRTHFCNDGTSGLAHKPTIEGLDKICTCSTSIPRSSLCAREHISQSSCRAWPHDGFHYRSFMGHATNSLTNYPLLDALNKRDGRCCNTVVPKCVAGCGFTKHCDVRLDQSSSTVKKSKHDAQMPARCCRLDKSEELRCQCSINVIARSTNAQTSFCKELSNKVTDQPEVPVSEKVKNVSEESVDGGRWPHGVIVEKKGSSRGSGISKEQLKFGFTTESSSVVVTKFSASPQFVSDDGSRIDTCSSSSYMPISTGCEKALNCSSRFHLDTPNVKRKSNKLSDESTLKENDNDKQCVETRKKPKILRCSEKHESTKRVTSQSCQKGDSQVENEARLFSCKASKVKRKHTTMQLNKPVKQLHSHRKILESDDSQSDDMDIPVELSSSDRKEQVEDVVSMVRTKNRQEGSRVFVRKLPKYVSLNCIVNKTNSGDSCSGSSHVDSSVIATGIANDNRNFPKIVPLDLILKKAKKCHALKPLCKTENFHFSEEKNSVHSVDKSSFRNRHDSPQAEDGMQKSKKIRYLSALRQHLEANRKIPRSDLGEGELVSLTDLETSQLSLSASTPGVKNRGSSASLNRVRRCEEFADGSACSPCCNEDKDKAVQACEMNAGRYKERLRSDDSCCVCGIPNLEPCNQLLECSKCYIKVHQACYGVPKVPKGQWFCRPCKTNTQHTVCVLCGYRGGAMTRALKAQNIVKSLLKGLTGSSRSDEYVHSSRNARNECANKLHEEYSNHDPLYAPRSTSLDTVYTADLQKPIDSAREENIVGNSSLLGPQTMWWVHVVCGLWTPGTKCPNASTMTAFDISGASPAKRNIACSVCNRTGGSFMKCRDVNCSVPFHPWCAHQRDLLQSELEGEHNKNIGFYGRCLDHATLDYPYNVNPNKKCLRSNNWTCARTEGFKGRKGEGCSSPNYKKPQEKSGECSVSQEQINAWLHINGSKSCIRKQKEYINYKQLKGFNHLVVYKSGIHGLGLYTSEFIPRGSMVIEYVGEIVGQRVADKREIEYQSGKRKQYKSACYFFKIDNEHIIDATRKGGVARFINHSCLPNCVAKIISVRNGKKVMFFAERHINPGEEITYDYHFNREDEGQRIPCFCRSKGCRRYLN